MDFQKYLEKKAKEIDREMDSLFKTELKETERTDKKLAPLIKAFISACQGGKGIRGALVLLGYQLSQNILGREYNENISKVAAAYEIMHTAILAHDDIMDQSLIRRDKPSLYAELGNNHYGIAQAITLGDWGFFLSFKLIAESSFNSQRKNAALALFSQTMMNTTLGQMLDLQKVNPLLVMKFKTAYYTVAGPLQIGAILGGGDQQLIAKLGEFGENLGIAYQIRDDILDSETSGTIGVGKAEQEAQKYINQAMTLLPSITKDQKISKLLEQMGEYLVHRTK